MEIEEINIQGCIPGRDESPTVETTTRLAIEAAMRELVGEKLLYQKVTVDLGGFEAALARAGVRADRGRIEALQKEMVVRPWRLDTRHIGDDALTAEIYRAAGGGQPIGTPLEELLLHFYAPSVQLRCRRCQITTTSIAVIGSSEQRLGHPFPRGGERGTEQVYTVFYRCEACRSSISAVLIRREGLKLHLCGFAPRREQKSPRTVPPAVAPILIDAANAVAEGDLFAGFYHLRTMLEHFLKQKLGLALDLQMRGEELADKYYETLPEILKSTLPSLRAAYEILSQYMHARTGDIEDYRKQQDAICDHIEGAELLGKYTR